ncbi:MAG: ABC transporter ATP-binding protein [Clostridiaceae bacterium]|nr:ABC transporter ATP-binding protein [Eubacteriales bacterium]
MSLLKVENLTTYYETRAGDNQALEEFCIDLNNGETLGLIGESGCGKSTAGFSILNMVQPPGKIIAGKVMLGGRDIMNLPPEQHRKVLWREIAMIPQSSMNSLNPVHKIGKQIVEAILLHNPKTTKEQAKQKAMELLCQVGLDEKWFDAYPHKLSGGMKQRVIIAMALSCDPSVLISDESTTGLDVLIQAQILALLKRLQKERDLSLIMISHDLHMISSVCTRIGVMYAGYLVEAAPTKELVKNPYHPYTKALFASNIDLKDFGGQVESIEGVVPKLIHPENRCRFYNRCHNKTERCEGCPPPLRDIGAGHYVACYREVEHD